MLLRNIVFVGLLLFINVSICDGIICYQCSDSAEGEDADCINGVHGLSVQRADFEKRNRTVTSANLLRKYPALKDCSHYRDRTTGRPLFPFCKIERVHALGNLNAYIRDCSNGSDFSADLNLPRLSMSKGYLRADNQSTCGYSNQHLANMCVQICDTDFCNGPFAGQNFLSASRTWTSVLTVVAIALSFM